MKLHKLSNICSIQSGGTPSRTVSNYWGGDIPWAKISDLEKAPNGFISSTEEYISEDGLRAIRGRIFDDGTLLFAMYGSVGKTAIVKGRVSTNQAILGIKPNDSVLNLSFLRHWLNSQQNCFDKDAQGVAQKNLSAGYIRDLEIPLPPLPEQRRIAAILDKADAIRRKRQQAIRLTEDFLRSVFLDMFGDPVTNPKGWEVKEMGDLLEFLTSGSRGWAKYYTESGKPFLRIQNVGQNKILLDDLAYVVPPENAEARRTQVKVGDLLLSITADLGRVCVVPDILKIAYINQHLALLRLNQGVPLYVSAFLASSGGQTQFSKSDKGGVKAGLNFADIRSLKVLFPPAPEQEKWADFYDAQQAYVTSLRSSEVEVSNLFDSLVQRAFRGDL